MFKGLSNLGNLLKQAQQFGGQMEKLTEEMKTRRATGTAGGGMVEVEINGLLEVLRCRVDPQLFAQGDRELVEDLVVAAVNQAVAKAKQLHADRGERTHRRPATARTPGGAGKTSPAPADEGTARGVNAMPELPAPLPN